MADSDSLEEGHQISDSERKTVEGRLGVTQTVGERELQILDSHHGIPVPYSSLEDDGPSSNRVAQLRE